MFRYLMAFILSNSLMRGCFTFLVGMVLILAGFYVSSFGISGAIHGDYSALYLAAAVLISILVMLFLLMAMLHNRNPFPGIPMAMPPPQNFKEDTFFERDEL
jgi:hypothetical protein